MPIAQQENKLKGTAIIWTTEEYATSRLKSDWKQQTKQEKTRKNSK